MKLIPPAGAKCHFFTPPHECRANESIWAGLLHLASQTSSAWATRLLSAHRPPSPRRRVTSSFLQILAKLRGPRPRDPQGCWTCVRRACCKRAVPDISGGAVSMSGSTTSPGLTQARHVHSLACSSGWWLAHCWFCGPCSQAGAVFTPSSSFIQHNARLLWGPLSVLRMQCE